MHRKSKIILAVVLVGIGFFLSLYRITESPPTWYDEGIYNQIAIHATLHGTQGMQMAPGVSESSGFVTGGYPFLRPISWSMDLFGIGILQVRLVMVIFIVLLFISAFYLIYKIFGIKHGLTALLLLVTFPVVYGNGKNVLGEIPGLFYLMCFLLCVYELEKREFKGKAFYILAGLTGGLCLATKPLFFLLGGAVVIAALLHRKSIDFKWKNLFVGFIVFLIPMALWFQFQFISTDSTSSILSYYANPYGLPDIQKVVFDNFLRFFTEASPMYFMLVELVWIVSYMLRFLKKEKVTLTETIAFTFSLLVSIAYLRTAGWYRYFFVAEILALIFLPSSLERCLRFTKDKAKLIFILIITALCLLQTYQLIFTSWVAVHYKSNISRDLGQLLHTFPAETIFFVYNVPEIVIFLPSQKYYQYLAPTDSLNFGTQQIDVLKAGTPDILITTSKQWENIKSEFTNYEIMKTVNAYVFLKKKS